MVTRSRYGGPLAAGVTPGYADNCIGLEYTADEVEFMMAIERFEREHHKPWPDCRDVLTVARALGYRRVAARRGLPRMKPHR